MVNAEGTLTTRRRCSGLSNQSVDVRDELDIRAIFHFDVVAQVILAFLWARTKLLQYCNTRHTQPPSVAEVEVLLDETELVCASNPVS